MEVAADLNKKLKVSPVQAISAAPHPEPYISNYSPSGQSIFVFGFPIEIAAEAIGDVCTDKAVFNANTAIIRKQKLKTIFR